MPVLEPHREDAAFLAELTEVAFEVAGRFGLPLCVVEHKRRPHPGGASGLCYCRKGRVSLALRWRESSEWWPHPRDPGDVWCTLAHELAHLKEPNHGAAFKEWAARCRDAVADALAGRNRRPLVVATLRSRSQMEEKVMKGEDVQVGDVYAVNVSGTIAPVVIDEEHSKGGWVGTNQQTNRQVRIKSARRLGMPWDEYLKGGDGDEGEADTARQGAAKPEAKPDAKKREKRATRAKGGGDGGKPTPPEATKAPMSGLDAAAKVLAESDEPLNCAAIVERAFEAGYWQSDGKTPAATIYSAILREIQKKGDESRFRKAERGKFDLNLGA
jgi:hypothetical protein